MVVGVMFQKAVLFSGGVPAIALQLHIIMTQLFAPLIITAAIISN